MHHIKSWVPWIIGAIVIGIAIGWVIEHGGLDL